MKWLKSRFWEKRPGAFEKVDSKPMSIPTGFQRPKTLEERMMQLLQDDRLRAWAKQSGHDTPEEFDDFGENDDEGEPTSPYEIVEASGGREMTRAEAEVFEREIDHRVNAEIIRRKNAARQKRQDAASKRFKEEVVEQPAQKPADDNA